MTQCIILHNKEIPYEVIGECWEPLYLKKKRYPNMCVNGVTVSIARATLGLWPGDKLHACHTCDNPRCIRPDHIWAGTAKDNHGDKITKCRHSNGQYGPYKKDMPKIPKNPRGNPTSIEELERTKQLVDRVGCTKAAEELGLTYHAVYARVKLLGTRQKQT